MACMHCLKPVVALGLCRNHYMQQRRTGDALARSRRARGTLMEMAHAGSIATTNECIEGPTNADGSRPTVIYNGTRTNLSRVVWILAHGEPEGDVCHSCHWELCLNINHLYDGDHSTNAVDAVSVGQTIVPHPKGEKHGRSILTEDDVRAIRAKYTGKRGDIVGLAREYGVGATTMRHIVLRTSWTHIP